MEVEVISSSLEIITETEMNTQVGIAKRYPRDLKKCKDDVLMLAAADAETAESCFFALPRRKKNKTTGEYEDVTIEGESIRLAEIVSSSWKNIRTAKRILSIDKVNKTITAQAAVHDLENNTFAQVEETSSIATSTGQLYSQDMIVMTGKAAQSTALRNAIFQVIPKAFFKNVLKEIKSVAVGSAPGKMEDEKNFKAKPLIERAVNAVEYFVKMGVPEQRVLTAIDVKTVEEITEEHLMQLTGIKTGLKEKTFTLVDAFPETDIDKSKAVGADILASKRVKDAAKDAAKELPKEEKK